MNGAALLVRMLEAYGVRVVFGVPGETSMSLYAALSEKREAINHVMARDERSAGYMADAYARVTNRPGVVEFPSGAGPLYGVAAVAEANESSVAMIAITSDNALHVEGRSFIAEIDCQSLFKPITKESILLKSASMIPETVRRAFRIATSGRPGAVHIAIPENLYHDDVSLDDVSLKVETDCKEYPAYPASPGSKELSSLNEMIVSAQRPLIVAGGGVNRSNAGAALKEFVERRRIPIVTSITGQQCIPDDHEMAIGVAGDNGFHPHANRAMEEADLLIYVGTKIGSVISIGWSFPPPDPGRKIVHIDINPEVIGNNTTNALSMVADARKLFEGLLALPAAGADNHDQNWMPTIGEWRNKFWGHAAGDYEAHKASETLHPHYIMETFGRRLPENALVVSDPGTPTPYACRYLKLQGLDARLIMQRSYGGLGYAIPAAVGVWVANPKLRPVAFFGDGSLGMSVGEFETITRLGAPVICLNFNNTSFGWIEAHKKLRGYHNSMPLDFVATDCVGLARSYGLLAMRPKTPAEFDEALNDAFNYDGPVMLDLPVESVARETPPVYTFLKNAGIDPLTIDGERLEYHASTRKRRIAV